MDTVTFVLRCPTNHASVDPPGEVTFVKDWATSTSWANVIEGLLAENRCPCCPSMELEPSNTVLYDDIECATGQCPCCGAIWVTDEQEGWTCLDTGRLT